MTDLRVQSLENKCEWLEEQLVGLTAELKLYRGVAEAVQADREHQWLCGLEHLANGCPFGARVEDALTALHAFQSKRPAR